MKESDIEPQVAGLGFYLTAFRELGTARPISMTIGAIPFTAIIEYFRLYPVGDFEEFNYLIRVMDNTFLDFEAKRQDSKSQGSKK